MQGRKIAVIGGGASGMMAAISAAKMGACVTIFESTKRVGNKILLTGNGKCNFTNLLMNEACYYCKEESFIQQTLQRFSAQDLNQFFINTGMLTKEKNGYMYPLGEQSAIVLDILRMELNKNQVCVLTEAKVVKIVKNNDMFCIETEDGNIDFFDKVIITTGGRSYPKTGSDGNGYKLAKKLGHTIYPTVPALVQLVGKDDFYKIVAGVRCEGTATLIVDGQVIRQERGEIQFTDYGISGIPVFQLSRVAAYGLFDKKSVSIQVDVFPDINDKQLDEIVSQRMLIHKDSTIEEFFCGLSNKKLCAYAIKKSNLKLDTKVNLLTMEQLKRAVFHLKKIDFQIVDTKSYDTAQVTAGGVLLSEINQDFSSKVTSNLYFAGEILDVDGICGGYNLHWAFASGYLAGQGAAGVKE